MKKLDAESPETKSADIVAGNIDALKALFPEAFTEGRIDFDVLKGLLGAVVDERDEKFGLNWHGKRRARQIALTPSTGTLLPCPDESLDWDKTHNLMIEGDNLEVLKLLQKSYSGKVKLIYIDPPYNTGRDFVYPDDFRDNIKNYLELTGQVEGGRKMTSNTDVSGRFHTDWLNMMYPRLKLARNILSEMGSIFITIDDGEVANLIEIMNDIFGEENFVSTISWHKRVSPANDAKYFSTDCDTIVVYAKSKENWRPQKLQRTGAQLEYYKNPDNDPRGPWNSATYTCNKSRAERPNLYYPITNPNTGEEIWPKETAVWKYGQDVTKELIQEKRLYWGAQGEARFPRAKLYLSEMDGVVPRSLWSSADTGHTQAATAELSDLFDGVQVFDTPKPIKLLRRIVEVGCTGNDDIILDFFAGSATTGHAVLEYNSEFNTKHRYIMVQLPEPLDESNVTQKSASAFCKAMSVPENIAELTKERLRRAARKVKADNPAFAGDTGFRAYKLASSNIRAWEPDAANLETSLLKNAEHLVPGRKEQDVLYELLLKLGLDLCVPIETKSISGKTIHSIGGGALIACLGDGLSKEVIEPLASGIVAWRASLAPAVDTRVVFKDSGFADDITKTNMAAILNQNGISDVRSL